MGIQNYKIWWKSRTVWLNIVASIAFMIQTMTGFPVPIEVQGYLVAILNLVLRFDTKTAVGG